MITAEQLVQTVANPLENSNLVGDIKLFASDHPYCLPALLSLLLLKHKEEGGNADLTLLNMVAVRFPTRATLYTLLNPEAKPVKALTVPLSSSSELEIAGKAEIIDRFLQAEPRIVPRESDFSTAEQLSRQSNEDKLSFVSETLAEIYIRQGNKSKAKKIYGELALKYPEKSSYFAGLIKNLED